MSASEPPVSEPVAVTPVFVDGLHGIEIDRHGLARLTLYAEQREPYDGRMERVVAARLIVPAAELRAMLARVASALAGEPAPIVVPAHAALN